MLITIFFIVILLCVFSNSKSYAQYNNNLRKNVLVLHSYDESLEWTNDVSSGIKSIFYNNRQKINLYFNYMDMKKNYDNKYLDSFNKFLKDKYKNLKFDLIICVDNDALEYLRMHSKEIFPKVPVIFTGINFQEVSLLNLDRNIFKGVIEEIQVKDTIDVMIRLHSNLKNIKVFSSSTLSGKLSSNAVQKIKYLYKGKLDFEFLEDFTIEKFLDKCDKSDKTTAILLMIDPLRDENNNPVYINEYEDSIKKNMEIPMYTFWNFSIGHGIVGGKMSSGFDQGKTAALIALKYLKDNRFEDIPFISYCTNKYIFDYNFLTKFNIDMDKIPGNSILVNKPFSFYENYKHLVISAAIIFAMLLIIIFILSFSIKRKKEDERKLNASYEELSAVYEELSATDEELRDRYKELVENQEKIKHLAYYDSLTNLPNRTSFIELLKESIESNRYNKIGAVYLIDIDNFKNINDTLGHDDGDELLKAITSKLRILVSHELRLFRAGGDEFLILKEDINGREEAIIFAKKLIKVFNKYFYINNKPLYISVSIGVTIFNEDGNDVISILKNVDLAMFKAKEYGKNRFEFYNKKMSKEILRKAEIEKRLRNSLRNNELFMHYQPQIDLQSGKICALEALIRWNNKELGMVSPAEFIKVAEETGLINIIGEWVLVNVCRQNKLWKDKGYNYEHIAVNISAIQLQHPGFFENVKNILDITHIKPEFVELEITENVLIKSLESSREILKKLMDLGIKIAIDDFGTGYSSLNYIRKLPINTLKIDKSFLDNICCNENEKSVAEGIIELAHKMNMEVVAEGVENEKQVDILKTMKCNKVQGYYFSKPLSKEKIEEVFNNRF